MKRSTYNNVVKAAFERRKYRKPDLIQVHMDWNISLVLASGIGPPNPPFAIIEFEPGLELSGPLEPLIF